MAHYYANDVNSIGRLLKALAEVDPPGVDGAGLEEGFTRSVYLSRIPIKNKHDEDLGVLVNYDDLGWAWEPPSSG